MKSNENIIKTENFYFSAFLIAEGCELAGIEPSVSGTNHYTFCFYNTETVKQLKEEFFSLRSVVKPQDFANAQRILKSIILNLNQQC